MADTVPGRGRAGIAPRLYAVPIPVEKRSHPAGTALAEANQPERGAPGGRHAMGALRDRLCYPPAKKVAWPPGSIFAPRGA